jgi:hypothetical protein
VNPKTCAVAVATSPKAEVAMATIPAHRATVDSGMARMPVTAVHIWSFSNWKARMGAAPA